MPPLHPVAPPSPDGLSHVATRSDVPVWLPWPLPTGWLVSGVRLAGDERSRARAVALATTGPAPLGGAADVVFVAEEPGAGLGARFGGLGQAHPAVDPARPATLHVKAGGHDTPLWLLDGPDDRCVLVGEAAGCWLWVVAWPGSAALVLTDGIALADARHEPAPAVVPFGAVSPHLA